jgi:predicted MFS family arabinose efflux permease
MLGALLGGTLIDNISESAPLVASIIILAIASIYVGFVMRASSPALSDESLAPLSM